MAVNSFLKDQRHPKRFVEDVTLSGVSSFQADCPKIRSVCVREREKKIEKCEIKPGSSL